MEVFFQQMIEDSKFVEQHSIATLNSLNWCRIMVQVSFNKVIMEKLTPFKASLFIKNF